MQSMSMHVCVYFSHHTRRKFFKTDSAIYSTHTKQNFVVHDYNRVCWIRLDRRSIQVHWCDGKSEVDVCCEPDMCNNKVYKEGNGKYYHNLREFIRNDGVTISAQQHCIITEYSSTLLLQSYDSKFWANICNKWEFSQLHGDAGYNIRVYFIKSNWIMTRTHNLTQQQHNLLSNVMK